MAAGSGSYRGAVLATGLGHVVLVMVNFAEIAMGRRKAARRVIRVSLQGEVDSRWMEGQVRELGIEAYRWYTRKTTSGAQILLDGLFKRGQLDQFIEIVRQKYEVRVLHVERR
jgi:hypothetical protein